MENPDPACDLELLIDDDGDIQRKTMASRVVAVPNEQSECFTEGCKDLCMCFCRTEVELGIGLAFVAAWSGKSTRHPYNSPTEAAEESRARFRRALWHFQRQGRMS